MILLEFARLRRPIMTRNLNLARCVPLVSRIITKLRISVSRSKFHKNNQKRKWALKTKPQRQPGCVLLTQNTTPLRKSVCLSSLKHSRNNRLNSQLNQKQPQRSRKARSQLFARLKPQSGTRSCWSVSNAHRILVGIKTYQAVRRLQGRVPSQHQSPLLPSPNNALQRPS